MPPLRGLKFLGGGIYKYFAPNGARNDTLFARFKHQRSCVLHPSVARCNRATLGENVENEHNSEGVVAGWKFDATPSELRNFLERFPRVARAEQLWAGGRNPVGILKQMRVRSGFR
jgi:hypothetical protein